MLREMKILLNTLAQNLLKFQQGNLLIHISGWDFNR
jgi:hypothetical protein